MAAENSLSNSATLKRLYQLVHDDNWLIFESYLEDDLARQYADMESGTGMSSDRLWELRGAAQKLRAVLNLRASVIKRYNLMKENHDA